MRKFPEMPYERPDVEEAKRFMGEAAARLGSAENFEAADEVFREVDRRSDELNTMFTIARIRHDINTEDKFYDAEVEFARLRPARAGGICGPLEPQPGGEPLETAAGRKILSARVFEQRARHARLLPRDSPGSCSARTRCARSTPSCSPRRRSSSRAGSTRSRS